METVVNALYLGVLLFTAAHGVRYITMHQAEIRSCIKKAKAKSRS